MKTPLALLCFSILVLTLHAEDLRSGTAPAPAVSLKNFKLTGDLAGDHAAFTLSAVARVEEARGGSIELLSGPVALTALGSHPKWHIRAEQNRFILVFDRRGEFPVQIKFSAAVRSRENWNTLDFHVASTVLQPIVLRGLPADTQFQFPGAARPERHGPDFVSYLPADGSVNFAWKEVRPEGEGKLFFSAEMLGQINISPGLMRQAALFNFKVMQGELDRVVLQMRGAGEVTRVQGDQVLGWSVEPMSNAPGKRLIIQLNQPQKDQFAIQVQLQNPLGAFPQSSEVPQLRPERATRFAGYFRVVNEGAVRLEVTQATGLSQISPEQFPESDATRAAFHGGGSQRFAYRFAGADFLLRIQADQILPEVAVSELLSYHDAENELALDAEIELDVREAPLRELLLRVPKGYAVAKLNALGLSDYFLTEPSGEPDAELRLVYNQPVAGRQLVQLRLEHNQGLSEGTWTLPRIRVLQAKSVRGFVGVSADTGFRITPERTQALTEIATAFFPGKPAGLQSAFRLNDTFWEATVRVEKLPQTIQADALHLFSIGEGIAYGSSLINYVVSGAPVSAFKVRLSAEYANVEFSGKDIRSWQKVEGGFVVQLHTPVSGPYTLLATYERPFRRQGETLAFNGVQPLDVQSEQGYTLITSAYQFEVKSTNVSSGLLPLESAEVPAEYRLFFDAPVLAAYRYPARPFNLELSLSPLAQGDSINQIVDRALLETHVSKQGQVLTTIRYFIKNRGNPSLGFSIPEGAQLWSATVNGTEVVPVADGKNSRIPLPHTADPNALLELDLKLAMQSPDPKRVQVSAPLVSAPVMLAEWKFEPDIGQQLVYRSGSLLPSGGTPDISGFAQWTRLFSENDLGRTLALLFVALGLAAATAITCRWAAAEGAYRFSPRHLAGIVFGIAGFGLILACCARLSELAGSVKRILPAELTFLAPVQQANSGLGVALSNVAATASIWNVMVHAWPALLAPALWIFAWRTSRNPQARIGDPAGTRGGVSQSNHPESVRRRAGSAAWVCGWTLLAWAALKSPNGAAGFIWVLCAFLLVHIVVPALGGLIRVPHRPVPAPMPSGGDAASAAAALILAMIFWLLCGGAVARAAEVQPGLPDSVIQTVRVEDKFALATARILWQATKGAALPLLTEPAVLTHVSFPPRALELVRGQAGSKYSQLLLARESGPVEIEMQYQLQLTNSLTEWGFASPVLYGLINQLQLTVVNSDVDVSSPQAVSVECEHAGSNSVAAIVLSPAEAWIGWHPRKRDVRHEKPVFYADISQLYAPSPGVIEGLQYVSIRPAQGELSELTLHIPAGATVTDVTDPAKQGNSAGALVSLWRFDPDTRQLRITLNPPQSRPFALEIRTQTATGPLPFAQTLGLVSVDGAAGQMGMAGFATGNEVQLDSVSAEGFSPLNLEDFPGEAISALQTQLAGVTLRRAFRYTNPKDVAIVKASAVEPDVRVEAQDTISLGEDHTVLADEATVDISRAGIFRLSFVLPPGFDIESISGAALSHWTELKTEAGRVITLHLSGKTEGHQQFALSLSGPGVKSASGWKVPQIVLREANKQRGTVLIVPEQGMRLQVTSREGYTQLDPQKSGIRQKGVLAFRSLQIPSALALDIQQVDPWIQVISLEHASVGEVQTKVTANLQYQIENTGLKSFHVLVPTNAEGVRFQGEQVADCIQVPGAITNGLQDWEVKLHRRVIGTYMLQILYQTVMPSRAKVAVLRGVEAAGVNLQRGFVTVQSDPRLEVTIDQLPESLQPTEWQSIPRALHKDLQATAANFSYRLIEPTFELPLKLQRHEAAKLLPAHINATTFDSVISDDGIMLTQARLEIQPGDKRLLSLTLPAGARFWFAFVNDSGVWPWREKERILIPLEQQSRGDKPVSVEVFYSCRTGSAGTRALDLELLAPKFELPLENITWRVSLSKQWQLKHWTGSLQLEPQAQLLPAATVDLQSYLQNENSSQLARTKEAEEFMTLGNQSLEQGNPQKARRAFEAAFDLSTHDAAFNEDARVQLHNVKLQQALVGLNVRQTAAAGDSGALGGKLRDLRHRPELNYTQQDAKDIIDNNTADENAAFLRLAEKLIQQQDAAVSSPAVIRASIPAQGQCLTFKRAVAVDAWADLKIDLSASRVKTASLGSELLIILCAVLMFAAFRALGPLLLRGRN